MIRPSSLLWGLWAGWGIVSWPACAFALEVMITPEIATVEVIHQGKPVVIQRVQVRTNKIDPYYSFTSRKCPPFCIQPMQVAPGVTTIGELEVLEHLKEASRDDSSTLVVDTRTPEWPERGMIPGAINVPWTALEPGTAAAENVLVDQFGVRRGEDGLDFSEAKTVVGYCNGPWCSQSTHFIQHMLELGYPPEKLKWYRGGMQSWESFALTTVTPEGTTPERDLGDFPFD